MPVTHSYVSAVGEDAGSGNPGGKIGPSEWNAGHTVIGSPLPLAGSNLTFYVATTGNDSNAGTIGSPFLTIQHALDVAAGFDYKNLYNPTINVADGTYLLSSARIVLPELVNCGGGTLVGNVTTPTNCIIRDTGAGACVVANGRASQWGLGGFEVDSPAQCFIANNNCTITINQPTALNDSTGGHNCFLFQAFFTGQIFLTATITILTANFGVFASCENIGVVEADQNSIIFQPGTAVHDFFLDLYQTGLVQWTPASVTNGTMTGNSYISQAGSIILSNNGLVSDIPGTDGIWFDDGSTWIVGVVTAFSSRSTGGVGGATGTVDTNLVLSQSGTPYTLAQTDAGHIIEMTNAGANTVTVPTNASVNFPINTKITVVQTSTGVTTITAVSSAVTVHNAGALTAQWKSAVIYQRAINEWVQINGAL